MQKKQPNLDTRDVDFETAVRILTGFSRDEFRALRQASPELDQKMESMKTTYRRAFSVVTDPTDGRILSVNMTEIA